MGYIGNDILIGSYVKDIENVIIGKGTSTFGILGNNNTGIALSEKILQRHILAIGAIGSGKSNIMFHIVNELRKNANSDDVFIFFDAKGDYYEKFYKEDDMVISNDLNPPKGTVYWNIYEEILATPREKRDELIREIATGIFKNDIEKSSAPIFAIGARDLFAAIISAQVRNAEVNGEVWNHKKLVEFLRTATDVTLRNLLREHEDLKWVRNYIKKESPSTSQNFIIHLNQSVNNIFSGAFGEEGDFSIKRAINQKGGKAVFLEYDLSSGYLLEDIYTLLIDISMKEVLGRNADNGRNGRVFFILDEFPLIPKLNYIDNALNFGRSLGVRIVAGLQNFGQVEYRYTTSLANSLFSGFGSVFAFRLLDESSRNIIKGRYGRNKRVYNYISSNSEKGVQDIVEMGDVIEDWDISRLKIGECIAILPEESPFRFYPKLYEE